MGQVPWKRSVRYDDPSGAWAAAGSRGVRVFRKVRAQGSCVRSPARLSGNKSVCPTREISCVRATRELVCPGQARVSVCPGRRKNSDARTRVSGRQVRPGGKSVCPTLGLDSGADSGARFVRVSGPGSSEVRSCVRTRESSCVRARLTQGPGSFREFVRVSGPVRPRVSGPGSSACPGRRKGGKSVCPGRRKGGKSVCPTLGLTQGPGSFVRFVRLSGLARARVSGPVRPTLGLDSGADSGARFVRVSGPGSSGPGSSVCPGQVRARFVGDDAVWRSVGAERAGASRRGFREDGLRRSARGAAFRSRRLAGPAGTRCPRRCRRRLRPCPRPRNRARGLGGCSPGSGTGRAYSTDPAARCP